MSTATIAGTITFPVSVGGPNAALVIGGPSITPTSTTGAQLTFTEQSTNTYGVPTGVVTTIPFGTISAANIVYVGTDQPLRVKFNGGSDTFTLAAGGYILMYNAGVTAMTVEATVLAASVQVMLLGS